MEEGDFNQQEYNDSIKKSVEDGSYFKDAFSWYIFRYVGPICERTMLFFIASFAAVISYVLVVIVNNSLPMKQDVPIIMWAQDTSLYYPVIHKLQTSREETKNVDEAVIKYLITNYVEQREAFDFRKSDIETLNNKFAIVKNNSSVEEYRAFQSELSRDNPDSPIKNWGKNVVRKIKINSVEFDHSNDQDDTFLSKAKNFMTSEVPSQVQVRYTETNINNGVASNIEKLIKISFKFSGIDPKNINKPLDFEVVGYKIYKIK